MTIKTFACAAAASLFAAGVAGAQPAGSGSDMSDWYEFKATSTPEPGAIGMQDWLHAPAGKFGRIEMRGDQLVLSETGEPITLWGLNNCYAACAPEKDLAEQKARFYAKYGINSVRLHKYADGPGWAGIQSEESFARLDPAGLDRMDHFVAKMKEHGIYTKLSPTFGVKLGPADLERVPYANEFGEMRGNSNRTSTGHGSIFISNELQDLLIEQVTTLLRHENPYTGMTYAEDPAILVIELFNEDSALFHGTQRQLERVPTLRRMASERFTEWLRSRYGDHAGLVEAWGAEAIDSFRNEGITGENLDQGTVVPAGNPWFYDPEQLAGSQKAKERRLHDTMLFWYEQQNAFYDRFVQAIRETGYDGEILASNWQAGRAFSHYYNLHSDARIGIVDRHNYFGGGNDEGEQFNNNTMLATAGSGLLGTGLQQVADRPFMFSEWIHVWPSEWGVEGPAILGAYGMGLQGWDVSYMFQNRDDAQFSDRIGRDRWDVTAPQVLGVFPAVSRQVLRGDVKESVVVVERNVHVPSLHEGKLGFEDRVTQDHDVKTFDSGAVPAQTLAVARTVVDFTEEYEPTPSFDLSKYLQDDGTLVSSTGQLRWTQSDQPHGGHFTMDTPGTKAVVGFAQGGTFQLGPVTITPESHFGAIYVTAQGKDETVESADRLLVVAVARARNTGQRLNEAEDRLLAKGEPPILMEPVKATIAISRDGGTTPTVTLLDHDGLPTQQTLEVTDGRFTIDGARDKTMYYLVSYE